MSSPLRHIAVGGFFSTHTKCLQSLVFYRKDTIICLHKNFSLTLHPITNTKKDISNGNKI